MRKSLSRLAVVLLCWATTALAQAPMPIINVDGLNQTDAGACPSNANVAVGPTQVVQVVNNTFAVYTKTGSRISGPTALTTVLNTAGCAAHVSDPTIIYDRQADRWWLAAAELHQRYDCIAVSQTSDATGSWYAYEFEDNGIDAPVFGLWNDYLYEVNYASHLVIAYDRRKMIAGDATASSVSKAVTTGMQAVYMQPVRVLGYGPETSQSAMFAFVHHMNDDGSSAPSAVYLWEFAPNFANPAASTWVAAPGSPISIAAFVWPGSPDQAYRISQFKPTYPVYYRLFPGVGENIVMTFTVAGSGSYDAIHWVELTRPIGVSAWSLLQEGTYGDSSPRYNPAIAEDAQGNFAIGYTCQPTYQGVCYGGWTTDMAPGSFTSEYTAVLGSSYQSGLCSTRWGDWAGMTVDPTDGCTFWHTNMYVGGSGSWLTRLVAFQFPSCTGRGGVASYVDCCDGRGAPTPFPCLPADNGYCPPGSSRTDHAQCNY